MSQSYWYIIVIEYNTIQYDVVYHEVDNNNEHDHDHDYHAEDSGRTQIQKVRKER